MNLENSIKDIISIKLEDGSIEKMVSEQLEKGVLKALDNLFGSYGDVTKVIEKEIKSVMIPYLENYDYSEYITKLDSVLVEVLKSAAADNKNILVNFKELMTNDEMKTIKASEIYEKWMEYVAENVDTSELEVEYDCDVSYENVDVSLSFDEDDNKSWGSFSYATLTFECEKDEKMNFEIKLSKYNERKNSSWDISYESKHIHDIRSLKHLNEMEIFLMKLSQNYTKIEIDKTYENDEVTPKAEPEASYN
ncbi:hypothetical protein [Clostridium tagluense]|uniref:Phage protein n=1 Tax=Clostridium tagluense TaxID=360422 RepID=A0A401UUL1_9CLOT|nr:hypothetical protein [Clostridium tagluense]GCD13176.1 phage protein [Clostridium tagluense]